MSPPSVEVDELRECGRFELVAIQPFVVAALAPKLLPTRAGVVAVEAARSTHAKEALLWHDPEHVLR
jgi:hypothetical protein